MVSKSTGIKNVIYNLVRVQGSPLNPKHTYIVRVQGLGFSPKP
jgi:hypothetical protein